MGKDTIRQFKNKVEISLHNIFMFHLFHAAYCGQKLHIIACIHSNNLNPHPHSLNKNKRSYNIEVIEAKSILIMFHKLEMGMYFYKQWRPRWNAACSSISSLSSFFAMVKQTSGTEINHRTWTCDPLNTMDILIWCGHSIEPSHY